MKKTILLIAALSIVQLSVVSQGLPLSYYLPDIEYNKDIPTPEDVLGFQIGDWHLDYDKLVMYMQKLTESSNRIIIREHARSHEYRPLVHLIITSPENHKNLDKIRQQHLDLSNPDKSTGLDIAKMPIVVYQGYSIHGNESSGSNAAPLVAWYLAAAKGNEIDKLLNDVVIILDPSLNPDGLNRFASWVNMHKSKNLVSDPQSREFNAMWPSGRTNHYWFDMNRDWIATQQPESKGRIKNFHYWKPNILTDHHEMGADRTYFFQPGVPERVHPLTLNDNQELTKKMAEYHAAALDEIGSLYYSGEGYDDYYYGKGSAYPDVNGGIGILFEQASSRGHIRETPHGEVSFPFGIRNQIKTSFSTLKSAQALRTEFLEYQRKFYKTAIESAQKDNVKAYVFQEKYDKNRLKSFIELLQRHQITVHKLSGKVTVNGHDYTADHGFIIPLNQAQYRMVKSSFEKVTSFEDSVFYDVTSWTIPLAFNIQYSEVTAKQYSSSLLGSVVEDTEELVKTTLPPKSEYAYVLAWDDYYSPKALNHLMKEELNTMVSIKKISHQGQEFASGAIVIPVQNQKKNTDEIYEIIKRVSNETDIPFYAFNTGLMSNSIDLGGPSVKPLTPRKILLLVGSGVSSYDAGEVWHLFDQQYQMPISMIDVDRIHKEDLNRYNTFIMVDGSYSGMKAGGVEKLKQRIKEGATLIVVKRAVKWANTNELIDIRFKKAKKDTTRYLYERYDQDLRSMEIKGAIFQADLDISHPIGFGYHNSYIPVFRRGDLFYEPAKNSYANPLVYTSQPLISGYIRDRNYELIKNAGNIIIGGYGTGKVICMTDNFIFRAYWKGTTKLFANAVFFSQIIDEKTVQKGKKKKAKK